jgi:type III restriction enzyme
MELNNYQLAVMKNLTSYMDCLDTSQNIISAWREYWDRQDIKVGIGGVPSYNDTISGVPHICMKVPTGGGKTFMACSAIKRIFSAMPIDKPKVVVWLVPSDPILNQTIKALTDVKHPYRQKLDTDFSGRVGVYTKEQLLNGQNFSPDTVREMLTVCILSYGSLRINSKIKDVRKVYQENGNLLRFADYLKNKEVLLADTPDTALIQVLRQLEPVTIVDESHNAESELSIEMLKNLNPSFILDLTATPRKSSNIISYVDPRELKKENMVKLPVIVYNRSSRQSVIRDAIQFRGSIESQAILEESNGGEYIRPIVLFQAQPNVKGKENETYDKIKQTLIDIGIPEEEIGIKTSNIDTIKNVDLMNKECKIRYIITVNALKEGWDCPFAYVLASLANKTSTVDVEQIVGRILRQPYAREHKSPLLNASYVLTCSNDFRTTLEGIVTGLNKAGFSKKDYRVGDFSYDDYGEMESDKLNDSSYVQENLFSDVVQNEMDTFSDISVSELRDSLTGNDVNAEINMSNNVNEMIRQATGQVEEYDSTVSQNMDYTFGGGELENMVTHGYIQEQYIDSVSKLKIPQFYLESIPDLFGSAYEVLEKENLSEGFSLSEQEASISFELSTEDMYSVDLQKNGEAVPKYMRVSKKESDYIKEYFATIPEERKQNVCIDNICGLINRNNRYVSSEIKEYVKRIIGNMKNDELSAMETSFPIYANKIQKKIETLENDYREKQFYKWIDSGKIVCRESYSFHNDIIFSRSINSVPYSLYDEEKDDMNDFERSVLDIIASQSNILWWHRNIEKKDFRINGFINHYPDFIVETKSGKILLIEAKGDYLDGDDSKTKLKLGRRWAYEAGKQYRYFMVFKDKELGEDGAYKVDSFVEVLKEL